MDKAMLQRSVIYIIIFAASYFLISGTQPPNSFAAHGIALPGKTVKPATDPTQIRLLPFSPMRYQVLGYINLETHYKKQSTAVVKQTEARARELAASVGAQDIIITAYGFMPASSGPMGEVYVFRGMAINER